ncbi:MAG: anaerobic ribonucleoside-triphosphate reductase [Methanomethylovorans sp.]|uniref:anaerobic ribonucleoside-triphosphate reductase n=1 Tax=Methanomethylovorans sp. TaxID=2758717 RepID=UPI00353126BC
MTKMSGGGIVDRLDFKEPVELIDDVLLKQSWLLTENSNTRASPSVIDLHIASQIKKQYALEKLYSRDVAAAHMDGLIHIHDLHSPFMPYCNGIDGRIIFMDGLKFSDTRSLPAKRLDSALFHVMSFMMHSQQFFAGAQAVDMLNWLLAPHLYFERMDESMLYQAVQSFMFQMNQSNRIGAQSAFTNIGLRLKCPSALKDEPVVYGGKTLDSTYTEFEDEAKQIYSAFMRVSADGDSTGAPFTFPLITTAITRDHDFNDPLWLETMQAASSTGAPYFLNLAAPYMEEDTVHAMCCRLLSHHAGGIWTAGGMGTGSNKVVTINLPGVALRSNDEDNFIVQLNNALDIARQALLEGQEIIRRSLYEWNLLPWLLNKTTDGVPYFDLGKRHLTFGLVGMNECLLNLTGEGIDKKNSTGIKIIAHILKRIEEFFREDGIEYTLEQTPAESTAHRLAMIDRNNFGEKAKVQGIEGAYYYTNSTHMPYHANISLIDRINIESEFHPYFTGGTICHIWMGESYPDPAGLNEFIRKLAGTKLAYFCFSPDFSVCSAGHTSRGVSELCPMCASPVIDHMSRVTGYYGHVNQWNPGKKAEYAQRHRYRMHC